MLEAIDARFEDHPWVREVEERKRKADTALGNALKGVPRMAAPSVGSLPPSNLLGYCEPEYPNAEPPDVWPPWLGTWRRSLSTRATDRLAKDLVAYRRDPAGAPAAAMRIWQAVVDAAETNDARQATLRKWFQIEKGGLFALSMAAGSVTSRSTTIDKTMKAGPGVLTVGRVSAPAVRRGSEDLDAQVASAALLCLAVEADAGDTPGATAPPTLWRDSGPAYAAFAFAGTVEAPSSLQWTGPAWPSPYDTELVSIAWNRLMEEHLRAHDVRKYDAGGSQAVIDSLALGFIEVVCAVWNQRAVISPGVRTDAATAADVGKGVMDLYLGSQLRPSRRSSAASEWASSVVPILASPMGGMSPPMYQPLIEAWSTNLGNWSDKRPKAAARDACRKASRSWVERRRTVGGGAVAEYEAFMKGLKLMGPKRPPRSRRRA
jgi:hypothetical protein